MPNYNEKTGIAYGVIAGNTLDPEVIDDMMFGGDSTNLTYESAIADARKEFEREYDALYDVAKSQVDPAEHATKAGWEEAVEARLETLAEGQTCKEDFVSYKLDLWNDSYEGEEEVYEGTTDGVQWRLSWLGGAIIVFIAESPVIVRAKPCSPCVPGAGDLDNLDEGGIECYGVPPDWLYKEV